MVTVGENIRQLRSERGWSQEELAEKLGFDRRRQSYISGLERGDYLPRTTTIIKLANVFGVDIQQVVYGINPNSDASQPTAPTQPQ